METTINTVVKEGFTEANNLREDSMQKVFQTNELRWEHTWLV